MKEVTSVIQTTCFRCGQDCEETLWLDNKVSCCYGCQTVYEILDVNNLCEYYRLKNQTHTT